MNGQSETVGKVRPRTPIEVRFWAKVERRGPDECWPWKASVNPDGYGWLRRVAGGKMAHAHRVPWEINRSPIPTGVYVLHKCDNPPCVNPAHLFLGTQNENMADMTKKGRRIGRGGNVGERNGCAKITVKEVREIRRLYSEGGVSQRELAERLGLTQTPISQIINGLTWKHVT